MTKRWQPLEDHCKSSVMHVGWGEKAGMAVSFVD